MSNIPTYSVYTPLTASEQDALARMQEGQDLYVEVVGWGFHPNPKITLGDKRLAVHFPMEFTKPEGVYVSIQSLQLQLRMRDGTIVARDTKSTMYNYQPLQVTAGMVVDMIWDISIDHIPEHLKGKVLPSLRGKRVATIKDGQLKRSE